MSSGIRSWIDYRRTFLRMHAARELRHTDDVLAVDDLWRRTKADWSASFERHKRRPPNRTDEQTQKRRLLDEFFYGFSYGNYSDVRVYLPIRIFRVDYPQDAYTDLTQLIQRTQEHGIVLTARSGAGKTVAARKAFCDCFPVPHVDPTTALPTLAGYLPCWMPIRAGQVVRDGNTKDLVELLLRQAAQPLNLPQDAIRTSPLDTLLSKTELCPPLLLFFDLNTAGTRERKILARALGDFQAQHPRHRCIVAYRSTRSDDDAMELLRHSGAFRFYDMQPVTAHQAEGYLRNIRNFEDGVRDRLELDAVDRDVDRECNVLTDLVRRHVRGSESLISTPLLMHWVSILDAEALDKIQTLTDLYRQVVDRHLERDRSGLVETLAGRSDVPSKERILTVMTRVALVIQSQAAGATRLSREDYDSVLANPSSGKPDPSRLGQKPWWPQEPFWHEAPYYGEEYPNATVRDAIREFSLLRESPAGIGFLHDSFIYYFAGAMALRWYRGPGLPRPQDGLDGEWFQQVVRRTRARPDDWELPTEFLGGTLVADGDTEPLDALIAEFLLAKGDSALSEPWQGLPKLPLGVARGGAGSVAKAVELAILRHGSWLYHHPEVVFQQVHNHLCCRQPNPMSCRTLAAELLLPRALEDGRCWLRRVMGRFPRTVWTMDEHTDTVESVAFLQDGRIASGSLDGTVKLWDPESGSVWTMDEHDGEIATVAALPDGRIVSGSGDGTVKLWDPESGSVSTMEKHTDEIMAVATLPDGRIVSGSRDGTVRLWDPWHGAVRTIGTHESWILAIAVSSDGRIVSGGREWDMTVKLWDPATGEAVTMDEHGRSVTSLAVRPDGQIISGSCDGTVKLWDPKSGQVTTGDNRPHSIEAVAALPDGRIVSGSEDGTGSGDDKVKLWDPATGEVQTMDRHTHAVRSVAFLDDGRIVSGSVDGTVVLWDPASDLVRRMEQMDVVTSVGVRPDGGIVAAGERVKLWDAEGSSLQALAEHEDEVTSLAILNDGRIVSGSDDHTVKLWDPESGAVWTMNEHVAPVLTIAVLPDGRIVSGSWDHTVKLWDSAGGEVKTMDEHSARVSSVQVLHDGRIVSGSKDHTVKLWDPSTGEVKTMDKHTDWVVSVAALNDGRIVTGSWDHTVKLWDPATGEVKTMDHHHSRVNLVAVLNDGRIVSASHDAMVKLRDPAGGEVKIMDQHDDTVESVAVLNDGRIVSGSYDKTVKIWDHESGSAWTVAEHESYVDSVAVLPDGRIVSGSGDGTIRLSDSDFHRALTCWVGASVTAVAIPSQGYRIAAGLRSGEVLVLDVEPEASRLAAVPLYFRTRWDDWQTDRYSEEVSVFEKLTHMEVDQSHPPFICAGNLEEREGDKILTFGLAPHSSDEKVPKTLVDYYWWRVNYFKHGIPHKIHRRFWHVCCGIVGAAFDKEPDPEWFHRHYLTFDLVPYYIATWKNPVWSEELVALIAMHFMSCLELVADHDVRFAVFSGKAWEELMIANRLCEFRIRHEFPLFDVTRKAKHKANRIHVGTICLEERQIPAAVFGHLIHSSWLGLRVEHAWALGDRIRELS